MSSGGKYSAGVYVMSLAARGSFTETEYMFGDFSLSRISRQRLVNIGWMRGVVFISLASL